MANPAEAGSGTYDGGITQGSIDIGALAGITTQPYFVGVMIEDAGLAVVSSVAGTGGWDTANGATYSSIYTVTQTSVTISFFAVVPGTTTSGTITATFSEDASRSLAHLSTWDEGAVTSIVPTTPVTDGVAGTSVAAGPLTMDDSTNNALLAYVVHAQDFTATYSGDFTGFASSPIAFGSGGAGAAAEFAIGGADTTFNASWTPFANAVCMLVEVAKGAGGSGGVVPIMVSHNE